MTTAEIIWAAFVGGVMFGVIAMSLVWFLAARSAVRAASRRRKT